MTTPLVEAGWRAASLKCSVDKVLRVIGGLGLAAATKGSLRGKFKRAGCDDAYLAKLLALF